MPPKADVRRLLKKQQNERKVTKVTHPFAKYDETGKLMCIVCNSVVKNDSVWQAHLGSTVHRDNIQKLKALKQQQTLKRRAPSPQPQDTNKRTRMEETTSIELDEQVEDSSEEEAEAAEDEEMDLPADFFDAGGNEEEEEVEEKVGGGGLPTGFFDDPEEEARIQGSLAPEEQAQKDLEKDVDMFNEAMVDVTQESKQVQDEDDETFWLERHYDISQEQAIFDSRVEKLKHMRQSRQPIVNKIEQEDKDDIRVELKSSVRQLLKNKPVKQAVSMFEDDESDSEEEEEDWRAQHV